MDWLLLFSLYNLGFFKNLWHISNYFLSLFLNRLLFLLSNFFLEWLSLHLLDGNWDLLLDSFYRWLLNFFNGLW